MDIELYVDEFVDAESRIIIIEEATELLRDGFPLDDEIKIKLESIHVCPERFQRENAWPASSGLRTS